MTFLYLATEDLLSELVGIHLVNALLGELEVKTLRGQGNGYLRSRVSNFRQMANHNVVVVLTDLDMKECAPTLMRDWFGDNALPGQLLFRVAVKEVEAWLLADREGFSEFLGINPEKIPEDSDQIMDPKVKLLQLAKVGRRELREDLLPRKGVFAQQGLGYNQVLGRFVMNGWSSERAAENSDSLRRTCERLVEARQYFEI